MERLPITDRDPGDEHPLTLGEMALEHWYHDDGRLRNGGDESPEDWKITPGSEEACEMEGVEF
jgi:hypothetical protein